jgi:AraC family transcriptional regulator
VSAFFAKIAVECGPISEGSLARPSALERALEKRALHGISGRAVERRIAQGEGWTVSEVLCTCDRRDRPFEERHKGFTIALVAAGSFQYRSSIGLSSNRFGVGNEFMTPGSILFGNPGQSYECGHEHGAGDQCISFWYAPDYFERLAAAAGLRGGQAQFRILRTPPLSEFSQFIAKAGARLGAEPAHATSPRSSIVWEELSLQLAANMLRMQLDGRMRVPSDDAQQSVMARVTRAVRLIERSPDAHLTIARLAREAGLSPYHFLRVFQRLTGVTPHQFLLRTRLRHAAMRIALEPAKILDIALDSGFGDVSNFNRAFRAEFGVTPARFRSQNSHEIG